MTPAPPAEASAAPTPPDPEAAMPRMTLSEHLVELRGRLLRCALALIVTMVVAFVNWDHVYGFVMQPYLDAAHAQGLTDVKLSVIDPGEGFITMMKLCFLAGFVAAAPYVLWQLWQFVAAGLYDHEKRIVRVYFPVGLALFALGVVTAYTVLIPFGLSWLIDFNVNALGARTEFRVESYTSLCVSLVFAMGLAFQLPLVMLFLQGTGVVSRATFVKYWRHAVVGAFVVGMLLTADPSPVTQTLMAIPLCGLYVMGIWGGRFVGAEKQRFRWWMAWPLVLGLALFAALLIWNKQLVAWWNAL
jgi:sec-independent protein translocase protein TatC